MDNFRDSYFQVDWDLTTKRLRGTYWGKQYDTGRGFAVTVINGGQVVAPTTEVLRLKWEKPDNTSGYVNATIVDGKFIVENIDQMFTVHGSVRADFELSVGGKFVASITFYVNVEKAVAVDAVASSSQFTALQDAVGSVDSLQQQFSNVVANVTVDSEVIAARGTEATLGARLDSTEQDYTQHKLDYFEQMSQLFKVSSNLINKDKAIFGYGIDRVTGAVVENLTTYLCDWIVVKENTTYVRNRGAGRVGFYDKYKRFISSVIDETFTTPINTFFIRLVFSVEPFEAEHILVQLNEGTTLLNEEYSKYIDPNYIFTPQPIKKSYAFTSEFPYYNYISDMKPSCDGTDPLGFNGDDTLVADIYAKYDALVLANPEYITKTSTMNDQSGVYPLNSYVFKPEIPVKVNGYQELPTIILVAGLHGNGTDPSGDPLTSVFSLYHFMEDICNGWRTSEALEYFRWNVNFVIIPVANPWGVENESRLNSNGVDLNRNFDYLHSNSASIYKGVSAFSENESQHIRDVVLSNKDNTILFMDLHTIGGLEFINNRYLLRYVLNGGKDIYNITNYTLGKMSRIWRGTHVTSTLTFNGVFSINENEPMMKSWTEKVVGIPSALIEMFDASDKYRVKNGAENITMNVEHLGNYLINAIRYFIQKND